MVRTSGALNAVAKSFDVRFEELKLSDKVHLSRFEEV